MNITQVKSFIRPLAAGNAKTPVMLMGDMGIGKSQAIQQIAEELGYTYVDLRLSTQEPGDLTGYPRVENGVTVWSRPCWIPADPKAKLMLVLEEVNRAPIDVRQAIFQACTEYKIHTHTLPEITQIVACINPPGTFYQVEDLDAAFLDRFWKVTVKPDADEWLTWMKGEEEDDRVIQFVNVHRDHLCNPTKDGAGPTPRSWHKLSRALKVVTDDKLLYELATGFVGKDVALVFRKFCDKNYNRPVTGKEILEGFSKVSGKLKKQRNDEVYNTVQDLVTTLKATKGKLSDSKFKNLVAFLGAIKAEWKVEVINNVPQTILGQLSEVQSLLDDVDNINKEVKEHTQ